MLFEALGQEWVESPQAVEVISYVDEAGLDPTILQGAIDSIGCHDLAHVSNMDRAGRRDACGDGVRAIILQLLGDNIGPVNRHDRSSMLEGDIKFPLALYMIKPEEYFIHVHNTMSNDLQRSP